MAYDIHVGDTVEWRWGSASASGKVIERFTSRVSRTLKGSTITRDATEEEPAYLIEQDDGDRILKSVTELRRI